MLIDTWQYNLGLLKENFRHLPKKDIFVGLMLSSLLINILGLILPFTIIQMYDRVIPNKSYNTFTAFIVIVLVVLIIELALKIMRGFIITTLDVRLSYVMNFYGYKSAVSSCLTEFEEDPFGVQLDRFNFINSLKDYYSGQYLISMCDIPFVLVYFIFFYCIQPYIGLSITVICLLLVAVSYLRAIKLKASHHKKTKDNQAISNFLIELFSGLNTIKTIGLEEQMLRRYERLQKNYMVREFNLIQEKLATNKNIVISSQIVIMTAALVGCSMIFKNYMTAGSMSACILLSGKIMQPISSLINLLIRWEYFIVANQEFKKIIDLKTEIENVNNKFIITQGAIKLENVTFKYKDNIGNVSYIFDGLNLDIKEKTTIAIHGDKLSGKSTLMYILSCLFKPFGNIYIDGENIDNVNLDCLRKQIAFVSEKSTLFPGTILENLNGFSDIPIAKVQKFCIDIGLHNVILAMPNGYQTIVGADNTLARGVKQLIIVARELIKDPKILLFDEADIDLELDLIMQKIVDLNRGNITIVIISAKPDLLYFVDKHYIIKNKKIFEMDFNNHVK